MPNRKMHKADIAEFFRRLAAARPIPETELSFDTPYTLLVAVVLSAQATDVSVNKATEKLYAVANTPQQMLSISARNGSPDISGRSASIAPRRATSSS